MSGRDTIACTDAGRRCGKSGQEACGEPGDNRESDGYEENVRIDRSLVKAGNAAGIELDKEANQSVGKRDAECSASATEQQRFGEKLANDAGTIGSESVANTEFVYARSGAGEQQAGDVADGNEKDEPDHTQKRPEHLLDRP